MSVECGRCGANLPEGAAVCPVMDADCPVVDAPVTDISSQTASLALEDLAAEPAGSGRAPDDRGHVAAGALVTVRGHGAGARYVLDRAVTTVGRHPESHIFLDDVTVSRRHAEVRVDGDQAELVDLGSLNGTYVRGERTDNHVLAAGDELQIGRFKFRYVAPTGAEG